MPKKEWTQEEIAMFQETYVKLKEISPAIWQEVESFNAQGGNPHGLQAIWFIQEREWGRLGCYKPAGRRRDITLRDISIDIHGLVSPNYVIDLFSTLPTNIVPALPINDKELDFFADWSLDLVKRHNLVSIAPMKFDKTFAFISEEPRSRAEHQIYWKLIRVRPPLIPKG